MPDLSEFNDVEEMDNRYIGKCVVYVEGVIDQKVWERIAGSDLADRLEFKVPIAEGSGSETVRIRVSAERPSNSKIFGLVDGEFAAQFGKVTRLIDCSDALFELQVPGCDGILFLSAHELENVLVGHSNLAKFVESHVIMSEIGSRRREDVDKHISKQAKRFYVAALIKYTWAHMYFREQAIGIGNVDHFRSNSCLIEEIRKAKQNIKREFVDTDREFRRQLVEIGRRVKARMDVVRRGGGSADTELVRLAEGKGLLIKLRNHWKFSQAIDGLLVESVCSSDFAKRFRKQLVAMTGV